jgi:serine/threonine protein kinase
MALDAAKGMNYLHSSDPPVIHRDLKSPNLLVDKHWRVKVCDFNLSRVLEEQAVVSSLAASNPRWLAPEILSGRGYTFSSDVYSFGVIMWELLAWKLPWHDCGPWQVVKLVTDDKARPPIPDPADQPTPGFPGLPAYISLMNDCWQHEPDKRPRFSEIITRLRSLLLAETQRAEKARRAASGGTTGSGGSGGGGAAKPPLPPA